MKEVPVRKCVVTKERLPREELFRVVRTPSNEVLLDTSYKMNGRGAYIKKDLEVIKTARSKKILDKELSVEVNEEVYLRMEAYLKMK